MAHPPAQCGRRFEIARTRLTGEGRGARLAGRGMARRFGPHAAPFETRVPFAENET